MNLNNKGNLLSIIYNYSLRSFYLLNIFSINQALADNCQNVGELGTSRDCNGKLIVNRENLLNAISDGSYTIEGTDQKEKVLRSKGTINLISCFN